MAKGLKGTKSHENLKNAFAGESQANRRYLYFARVADIEGYPDVGGLFRDTSEAETGHAFGHLDFLMFPKRKPEVVGDEVFEYVDPGSIIDGISKFFPRAPRIFRRAASDLDRKCVASKQNSERNRYRLHKPQRYTINTFRNQ